MAVSKTLTIRLRTPLTLCLSAAFGIGFLPTDAHGNTSIVTSCEDNGPGTLRQAVADASNDATIDLSQVSCTITLKTGEIATSLSSVTITAYDSLPPPQDRYGHLPEPPVTIDASGQSRVFNHSGSGTLALIGVALVNGAVSGADGGCVRSGAALTLRYSSVSGCESTYIHLPGGYINGRGGGIFAHGPLTLDHSTVTGNASKSAKGRGGGLYADTSLFMTSSVVSGNAAYFRTSYALGGVGGGIYLYSRAPSVIAYSTINGNQAGNGAGLQMQGALNGALRIVASTISGNSAIVSAGGITVQSASGIEPPQPFVIYNSTIAFNTIDYGGAAGVALAGSSRFVSSVVANNTNYLQFPGVGVKSDVGAAPNYTASLSGNNNVITGSTIPLPADSIMLDPMLAPLADNGGPTPTHALLTGSPAIDTGVNPLNLRCDQRYFNTDCYPRHAGTGTDIGAYEFGALRDRIFANGFEATPQ
jgi:hypothetical protein